MRYEVLFGLLMTTLGMVCIYLGSPQQRWIGMPWPSRPARVSGALCALLGWLVLSAGMQALVATYVWLTALMLVGAALPYVRVLIHASRVR